MGGRTSCFTIEQNGQEVSMSGEKEGVRRKGIGRQLEQVGGKVGVKRG